MPASLLKNINNLINIIMTKITKIEQLPEETKELFNNFFINPGTYSESLNSREQKKFLNCIATANMEDEFFPMQDAAIFIDLLYKIIDEIEVFAENKPRLKGIDNLPPDIKRLIENFFLNPELEAENFNTRTQKHFLNAIACRLLEEPFYNQKKANMIISPLYELFVSLEEAQQKSAKENIN